jgi:hypothetical protein
MEFNSLNTFNESLQALMSGPNSVLGRLSAAAVPRWSRREMSPSVADTCTDVFSVGNRSFGMRVLSDLDHLDTNGVSQAVWALSSTTRPLWGAHYHIKQRLPHLSAIIPINDWPVACQQLPPSAACPSWSPTSCVGSTSAAPVHPPTFSLSTSARAGAISRKSSISTAISGITLSLITLHITSAPVAPADAATATARWCTSTAARASAAAVIVCPRQQRVAR